MAPQAGPGLGSDSKVEEAEVAPPPSIKATIHHHHSKSWKLNYAAKNLVAGTKVRFYERGKDSIHGLGTVSASKGSLTFTPTEALARARTIYATVIASTGVPLQTLTVARYSAPRPFRPVRPGRLRFVRRGNTAVLSWGAVSGVRVYRVRVKGSDGRLNTFFARPSHRGELLPNVLPSESFTATVTAEGGQNMLPGRPRDRQAGAAEGQGAVLSETAVWQEKAIAGSAEDRERTGEGTPARPTSLSFVA